MADLLEHLKASLGPQYRFERELGGGGMSRVFLAEELALGRKVVVKLLPPELAAVLSADRFQREVRVGAALQHPHIVPLLAAGRAGEVLYYTMPFVEGESLRARISREGELPVPEAVRLLREVADALAYAHQQGIIHRDIKPDNILLSHGHAVVTDFGIAKALSAAGGAGGITGTGVAIGTPTYMAPEQASGDQVDQRTDLYSLGALGYELLTGEPPFRGATAQALIAAQMTRTAPPLAEARPSIPPALAAAIHRCLEKRPADRFQHAEELRAALDQVTLQSSGGTVAAAAVPARGREWSVPMVLGYFALAGAATLGVAWALRTLAGLPDWFFPMAVLLLAIGLPIVVLATLLHNRRLAGAPPSGGDVFSRLTLRKAVLGGVGAFVALGLVTGTYMVLRALGIGPVGTLVASGKLSARERLIIADFDDQSRDGLLGPAVTQAFRVDFSQSKLVSPVEADYVQRVLQRMQRPDTTRVSLAVAREIAQREGFKAVVAGELQQVGPSLLVSAQLVNAQSGEVLATVRETARDSTEILNAVDRVSKRLREKIGESLRSIRGNGALADVTTGSLEALRKYSQALTSTSQGDQPAAIAMLEESVALDSNFAMAWRKLGTMLSNTGERPVQAEAALTRAFRLRDRLTFREKKLTENSYYSDVRGDMDSASAALRSLLAEYPQDSWASNNLGVALEISGDREAAEQAYLVAARLEPENILSWGNIFTVRIGQGHFDSAAATLHLMQERFPPGPGMDIRAVLLPLGRRDFAVAESSLRVLAERYRTQPRPYGRVLLMLAGTQAIRGKLAEADRSYQTAAEVFRARSMTTVTLIQELHRSQPAALYRGDRAAAAARIDAALRAYPLERIPPLERPLVDLIEATVRAGQRERAAEFLAEFEHNPGDLPRRVLREMRPFVRGRVLSLRQDSLREAIAAMQRAEASLGSMAYPAIAEAFDRAGQPDSALAYYQRWADVGESWWEPGVYDIAQPVAYFRLAELYQAKGDTSRATEFYGRFAELWKDADPELQPKVKDAKRRIAELVAEPRRP